jgi:DNA-binding transcriptional regulator GbsR (MarR family)
MSSNNERANFVEEVGLFMELLGMTRMAGRILGFLMVSDKELVSFDDLVQVLQASKSSISTNLKTLHMVEFIKPVTIPGDRRTYYSLSADVDWVGMIEKRMKLIQALQQLFEKGLDLRANKKDKPGQWLQKTIEFYKWLAGAMPDLLSQWKKREY